MNKLTVLGLGNMGNQVVSMAYDQFYKLGISAKFFALNGSSKDLDMVGKGVTKIMLKDEKGNSTGAGRDREMAKEYGKASFTDVLNTNDELREAIDNADYIIITNSSDGGFGSGLSIMLGEIIRQQTSDEAKIIFYTTMPVSDQAVESHLNSAGYLKELTKLSNYPYIVANNGADCLQGMTKIDTIKKVNEKIVSDLVVLSGYYNQDTAYDRIDERDFERLIMLQDNRRIFIETVTGIKKKPDEEIDIEQMLIDKINSSIGISEFHGKVDAIAIIANLQKDMMDKFDYYCPRIRGSFGKLAYDPMNIKINTLNTDDNNVTIIFSGLPDLKDKVMEIKKIVSDYQKSKSDEYDDDDILDSIDITVNRKKKSPSAVYRSILSDSKNEKTVNIQDTFNKFSL